nr:retrotransposon protein, putative, Ty1-copia subclass [Tanacetum cinerariifolium]
MRLFGCPVTIFNTLDPLGKFDGKADEGFFVGYSMNSKEFRVFNSRTRIVEETLHIIFLENKPNVAESGPTWLFNIDTLTKSMNYKLVVAENQSNGSAVYGCAVDPNMPNLEEIVYLDEDEDIGAEADMTNLDTNIPGYTQEERIYYDEVFAPVSRIKAIRLFLAYASFKDFVVYQMDVKSAFLYGKIKEEVYVCQPLGFEDPEFPDRFYKVEKALYSLYQAPRA